MLIKSVSSVGLYCQHCGRIHIYEIPFFAGQQQLSLICPHCNQHMAVISYEDRSTIRLSLPCCICGRPHTSIYQRRLLPRVQLDKLYCYHDSFELGYVGHSNSIEAMLRSSQNEFEALHPGEGSDLAVRLQQMLETVNILHDMAQSDQLSCGCGSSSVEVDIRGNYVILECNLCGRKAAIDTANRDAVEELSECRHLSFRRVRRRRRVPVSE